MAFHLICALQHFLPSPPLPSPLSPLLSLFSPLIFPPFPGERSCNEQTENDKDNVTNMPFLPTTE